MAMHAYRPPYSGLTQHDVTSGAIQVEESWHQHGVLGELKAQLGGSTETVLEVSLPNVIRNDGLQSY